MNAASIFREHGISQAEIAEFLGASQGQVSRLLGGKVRRVSRLFEEVCLFAERLAGGVFGDQIDALATSPQARTAVFLFTRGEV